jgi:hypothetical protein
MNGVWSLQLCLLLTFFLGTPLVAAQQSNRVAIVVSLGGGEVQTRCVQFTEDEITGYEALSRADLAFEAEVVGLGASVCRIEQSGCPASDCFCQCKGGACLYWSYWQFRDGEWQYSQVGATLKTVADGDMEGWVWDIGAPNEAPAPPLISFEEVCDQGQEIAPVDGETFFTPAAPGDAERIDREGSEAVNMTAFEPTIETDRPQQNVASETNSWILITIGGLVLFAAFTWTIWRRR